MWVIGRRNIICGGERNGGMGYKRMPRGGKTRVTAHSPRRDETRQRHIRVLMYNCI